MVLGVLRRGVVDLFRGQQHDRPNRDESARADGETDGRGRDAVGNLVLATGGPSHWRDQAQRSAASTPPWSDGHHIPWSGVERGVVAMPFAATRTVHPRPGFTHT